MDTQPTKPTPSVDSKRQMVGLAMDLGYIIALPLVAFALLGKYLDAKYGTKPWITLGGILLAITLTTVWLTQKFRKFLK